MRLPLLPPAVVHLGHIPVSSLLLIVIMPLLYPSLVLHTSFRRLAYVALLCSCYQLFIACYFVFTSGLHV